MSRLLQLLQRRREGQCIQRREGQFLGLVLCREGQCIQWSCDMREEVVPCIGAGAFFSVACGVTESDKKTVLARRPHSSFPKQCLHLGLIPQTVLALRPRSPNSACTYASFPKQCLHLCLVPQTVIARRHHSPNSALGQPVPMFQNTCQNLRIDFNRLLSSLSLPDGPHTLLRLSPLWSSIVPRRRH